MLRRRSNPTSAFACHGGARYPKKGSRALMAGMIWSCCSIVWERFGRGSTRTWSSKKKWNCAQRGSASAFGRKPQPGPLVEALI